MCLNISLMGAMLPGEQRLWGESIGAGAGARVWGCDGEILGGDG